MVPVIWKIEVKILSSLVDCENLFSIFRHQTEGPFWSHMWKQKTLYLDQLLQICYYQSLDGATEQLNAPGIESSRRINRHV